MKVLVLWLLMLSVVGAQPGGRLEQTLPWRVPTCGLDFDRIPSGLSVAKALALLRSGKLALAGITLLVEQYELVEAYPTLASWLPLADSESSRLRLFRALAVAGGGKLEATEREALRSTMASLRENHEWKLALDVLGRLDEPALHNEAAAHLKLLIAQLEGNEEYGQRINRLELEALLTNQQPRLEAAQTRVQAMLALPRAERLRAETRLYAGLGSGYGEYLDAWARSRLVRETWGAEPAEQRVRVQRPQLRAEVVKSLRSCLAELAAEGLEADEERWIRCKLLEAVARFGGKLSEAERVFVREVRVRGG